MALKIAIEIEKIAIYFVNLLVFTVIELNFFLYISRMGLCSGDVMKTMLIIHQCFNFTQQCLQSIIAFSVSHITPAVSRLGVH